MSTVTRRLNEYKFGPKDFRRDFVETFQLIKRVRRQFFNIDGQLARTVETTKSWASALATIAGDPANGPPWLYADGNFHADRAEIFQTTRELTKKYEAFSDTSYVVRIDDFDVLLNFHKYSTETLDGKVPAAPTKHSDITSLLLRPLIGQMHHQCEWVRNSVPLALPWAETQLQMGKAAKLQQQIDSALVRSITIPLNPFVEPNDTALLIDSARMINKRCLINNVQHVMNSDNGQSNTVLTLWAFEDAA